MFVAGIAHRYAFSWEDYVTTTDNNIIELMNERALTAESERRLAQSRHGPASDVDGDDTRSVLRTYALATERHDYNPVVVNSSVSALAPLQVQGHSSSPGSLQQAAKAFTNWSPGQFGFDTSHSPPRLRPGASGTSS